MNKQLVLALTLAPSLTFGAAPTPVSQIPAEAYEHYVGSLEDAKALLVHAGKGKDAHLHLMILQYSRWSDDSYVHTQQVTLADIQKAIAEGADVNLRDKRGNTPLHIALQFSNQDLVQALLASGAHINAVRPANTFAPLHIAINSVPTSVVILLNAGADVNQKFLGPQKPELLHVVHPFIIRSNDTTPYTPLQQAFHRRKHLIPLLMEAGASDNEEDLRKLHIYPYSEAELKTLIQRGKNRIIARTKNNQHQIALLMIHIRCMPKDLAILINQFIPPAYTEHDNVPLTTMGGPASACTIEEIHE